MRNTDLPISNDTKSNFSIHPNNEVTLAKMELQKTAEENLCNFQNSECIRLCSAATSCY